MEADKAPFEEVLDFHCLPSVVISVSDDEAGQDEEKIYGEITVIESLVYRTRGESLEKMII